MKYKPEATLPALLAKVDRQTCYQFPAPAVYVANPAFWPSPTTVQAMATE